MTEHEVSTRIESDSMGDMEVPSDAYYGAQTQRAVINFPISDRRFSRRFVRALGLIKKAAAEVNLELGGLEEGTAEAIRAAAQEVIDGDLDAHFVIDIYQTGSGTSTNMNANEVIANRATEILGGEVGSKLVHPNDHVNRGQSSNDVIPTAVHVSAAEAIVEDLLPALGRLHEALQRKSVEFDVIIKIGRTHLQDATPIRLGQEFSGYARQVELGRSRLRDCLGRLGELAQGGTAVGTGLNTHPEFGARMAARLSELSAADFTEAQNHFEAQGAQDAAVEVSGVLGRAGASSGSSGLLDHARQGQSRDRRGRDTGRCPGHRQRRGDHRWGTVGFLRTQHHASGHGVEPTRVDCPPGRVSRQLRGALR